MALLKFQNMVSLGLFVEKKMEHGLNKKQMYYANKKGTTLTYPNFR